VADQLLGVAEQRRGAAMAGTPQGESFGLLTSDFCRADVTAVAEELAEVGLSGVN
jgi:hypothetical protein